MPVGQIFATGFLWRLAVSFFGVFFCSCRPRPFWLAQQSLPLWQRLPTLTAVAKLSTKGSERWVGETRYNSVTQLPPPAAVADTWKTTATTTTANWVETTWQRFLRWPAGWDANRDGVPTNRGRGNDVRNCGEKTGKENNCKVGRGSSSSSSSSGGGGGGGSRRRRHGPGRPPHNGRRRTKSRQKDREKMRRNVHIPPQPPHGRTLCEPLNVRQTSQSANLCVCVCHSSNDFGIAFRGARRTWRAEGHVRARLENKFPKTNANKSLRETVAEITLGGGGGGCSGEQQFRRRWPVPGFPPFGNGFACGACQDLGTRAGVGGGGGGGLPGFFFLPCFSVSKMKTRRH